jgi:hypothetical protein
MNEAARKYDAKIVLEHFNAKVGKEDGMVEVAGKYTLHSSTSGNGNRLVSFAQMYQLIILSTKFQHKKIHEGTWVIPGTNEVNQTDRVLVNRRRMHTVTVVRSMKRPDCDSDRFL